MKKFFKGMDISSLPEFLDYHGQVYDMDGTPCEVFDLLSRYGVNSIRLRIWNDPSQYPESGGYCDLDHTLAMAKQIRDHHMHFVLDYHYSDYWADPGQQRKPKAWENLSFPDLVQAVYDFTYQSLETLKQENCLPDVVQVGNEIRSGMLFPEGAVPNYSQLAMLVNAGIRAVRDISPDITVMIHLDQGGRFYYLKEWFDSMYDAGMQPIDAIGISFYSFWHGTFMDLRDTMRLLVDRYHLPVYIMESAHPWRLCENGHVSEDLMKTAGLPAGIEQQKLSQQLVMQIAASIPNEMGMGVYYWEPISKADKSCGSWGNNMGMIDEQGHILPSFTVYRDFSRTNLPFDDLDGYLLELYENMETSVAPQDGNMIPNGDFARGSQDWWTKSTPPDEVTVEFRDHEVYVSSKCNFTFELFRDIYLNHAGNYRFSIDYRGTNTTNVHVEIFLIEITYSGEKEHAKEIYPSDVTFVTHEMETLSLPAGQVRVGIRMNTPPVFGRIGAIRLIEEPTE